jgi:hypothetical protein
VPTLAGHIYAQVVLPRTTGLPEDVVTNTFHFHNIGTNTFEQASAIISDALVNFFNGLTSPATTFPVCTFINDQISRTTNASLVKCYNGATAPGVRVPEITAWTLGAVGNTTSYPAEVACCLSFRTVDEELVIPQARARGRVYIGPLNSDAVGAESAGDPRPDATYISRVLDAAERLADATLAEDIYWSVYSPSSNVLSRIKTAWVDNAFDTQRRRGAKATSRTSRTIF